MSSSSGSRIRGTGKGGTAAAAAVAAAAASAAAAAGLGSGTVALEGTWGSRSCTSEMASSSRGERRRNRECGMLKWDRECGNRECG